MGLVPLYPYWCVSPSFSSLMQNNLINLTKPESMNIQNLYLFKISRYRVLPLSGSPDHLCTVTLGQAQGKKTTWPILGSKYVDLIKDLKKS